jgi:hypothetical protein
MSTRRLSTKDSTRTASAADLEAVRHKAAELLDEGMAKVAARLERIASETAQAGEAGPHRDGVIAGLRKAVEEVATMRRKLTELFEG